MARCQKDLGPGATNDSRPSVPCRSGTSLGLKLILATKNPAYRAVAAVRSEASGYWRNVTLPFPEAGIRLLPQNSLGPLATTMQTYRERLQEAARELSGQYDTMKSEAERRLGTLFNTSDYPTTLDGLFDMEWSVVPIERPQYLVGLHPDVFQQEQARVRERLESAVELAEQAFATELQRLTAHLAERLTGLHDGQPKVFRDSAVDNLWEFQSGRGRVAPCGRTDGSCPYLRRCPAISIPRRSMDCASVVRSVCDRTPIE